MSPVSERVLDASPPVWDDREVRSLALAALARLQAGQSGVSPRLDQCDAPSLAMSTYAAEERDSQPAQRDELAHSRIVPTRGGVLPPANGPSPTAITENTGSQHTLYCILFGKACATRRIAIYQYRTFSSHSPCPYQLLRQCVHLQHWPSIPGRLEVCSMNTTRTAGASAHSLPMREAEHRRPCWQSQS